MLNSNYWKTAIIVSRIYHAVLWATRPTLNFMNNKMAARKRASRGQNGNKQNKYFKQRYLTQIELLERWASLHLSLYISHHCIFQKQFFCNPLIKHFCWFSSYSFDRNIFQLDNVRCPTTISATVAFYFSDSSTHESALFRKEKCSWFFFMFLCIFALFLSFFAPFQRYFGLFQKSLTLNVLEYAIFFIRSFHRHLSSLILQRYIVTVRAIA